MALVMLPCDLPWWSSIHKKLSLLRQSTDIECILEIMQKIHDLCNISLDPDEDKRDSTILDGLKDFLFNEMEESEREHFKTYTLMNLAKRAQDLKLYRPPRGLNFSLQQQPDTMEFNYNLLGALLANAFFSTFPKRTEKTHPTLQDYNFTNFFKSLDTNSQKAKFRSFLYYFDWLESITNNNNNENSNDNNVNNNTNNNNNNADDNNNIDNNNGDNNNNNKNSKNECIKISRKVMPGKQWLTIEDWLECNVPLCSLEIRHESKIERSRQDIVQTVFTSSRIGGNVLWGGNSQECMHFGIFPEMLATLLYVEALEDNEALFIENATQLTRIIDPGNRSVLEPLDEPRKISLCLMDAENYSEYPITQFEEDNILRELNKCLLAFRQNTTCKNLIEPRDRKVRECNGHNSKRLSPIGESGTNSPADGINKQLTATTTIIIKQASTVTKNASYDSDNVENDISRKRSWLSIDPGGVAVNAGGNDRCNNNNNGTVPGPTASGRRGRFIVLGSSGECLPVNRISSNASACESIDAYSSCDSGSDDYLSANESVADSEDDSDIDFAHKYSKELDTPAKRYSFAEKLREALKQSDNYTESTDDSYAVDISISGSKTGGDEGIRIPRGGSTGFVLTEDSLDEDFYNNSLSQEKEWLEKFRNKLQSVSKKRGSSSGGDDSNNSSKYSFSSEYSSDLEELYEQFSKWLENPILKDKVKELDPRDEAVLRFASSLLKRTLSESFVGVPLTDGCISSTSSGAEENSMNNYRQQKNRPILTSRSLSLELAKHKHRLAAHLKKAQSNNRKSSSKHSKWSITRVQTQQTIDCDDVILKISQIGKKRIGKGGVLPVATGNWGCGDNLKGDVQLKLAIQWMAASVAGLPLLVYYTSGHERLTKLDTVCRLLLDRQWTVSELAAATLQHAKDILGDPISLLQPSQCFFDKLIGI